MSLQKITRALLQGGSVLHMRTAGRELSVMPSVMPSVQPQQKRNRRPQQRLKLAEKVAIITGSTDGIGLAMAQKLGEDGASVVISSRKQENVDRALTHLKRQDLNVHGFKCHVGDNHDVQHLVDETLNTFGGVDIAIFNAAVNPITNGIMNCPESVWDKVHEVNLKSPFLLTQKIVPLMKQRGGGAIVYVTSITAFTCAWEMGAYVVSKTGLTGLMKVVAQEVAKDNIRVNCLAPGVIKTKFGHYVTEVNKEIVDKVLRLTPMERFGEAHEMAAAASFLCSDDSSFMTGETLCMAGGMHGRL